MNNKETPKIKPKLLKRIYKLSKETKKDPSYHFNKALEDYIDEQEDLKEALNRLHDERDTVISPKQLKKVLAL
jgi:predicted DNA-binding protein